MKICPLRAWHMKKLQRCPDTLTQSLQPQQVGSTTDHSPHKTEAWIFCCGLSNVSQKQSERGIIKFFVPLYLQQSLRLTSFEYGTNKLQAVCCHELTTAQSQHLDVTHCKVLGRECSSQAKEASGRQDTNTQASFVPSVSSPCPCFLLPSQALPRHKPQMRWRAVSEVLSWSGLSLGTCL